MGRRAAAFWHWQSEVSQRKRQPSKGVTDVQKVTRVEVGVNLSSCNVHESSRPLGVQRKRHYLFHIFHSANEGRV